MSESRPRPWSIAPIDDDGKGFMVWNGRAAMACWALDPALPWVLVEGHHPLDCIEWTEVPLPLSPASFARQSMRCVSHIEMDMLFATQEFFKAIEEFDAASSGGLKVWQFDRKPRAGLGLWHKQFDPKMPAAAFEAMCRGCGVRLAIILPHLNEVSRVSGVNPADVRAAWLRGMALDG